MGFEPINTRSIQIYILDTPVFATILIWLLTRSFSNLVCFELASALGC